MIQIENKTGREIVEKKENIRELAVQMLMEITSGKEKSHILIRNVLDKYQYLPAVDRNFLKKVTEGTLERMITIDYVINQFSKVPVNKMKPFIRNLMRMSVYQILYLDKVPDSAACNEAVKLAVKRGFGTLRGFVNGVLRNIARSKDTVKYPDKKQNFRFYLSIMYSMPEFIIDLFLSQYGAEQTEQILNGYLVERPICVRLSENLSQEQKNQVFENWKRLNFSVKAHTWLSYAYELTQAGNLREDINFCNGWYTVQDISSMLTGEIADIHAGDYVVDVCSAPGGKAMHACDKLKGKGIVDARDVSDSKLSLIMENKERMRADVLEAKVWDARIKDDSIIRKADVVLLDVPCSGLGVIGRKPDIKYRLTKESLKELDTLQKAIIDASWEYVKSGGTLIYSTCTLRKDENEQMLSYLTDTLGFVLESLDSYLPEELHNEDTPKGYLTLLPSEKSDGFFMARLKAPY